MLMLFIYFFNFLIFFLFILYCLYNGVGLDLGGRVLRLLSNDVRKGKVRWLGGVIWEEDVNLFLCDCNVCCVVVGCYFD